MDPELDVAEPRDRKGILVPVAVALGIGLILGGIIGGMLLRNGSDVEVISGRIGAISTDLDALALEDSDDSFDLSHATLIDCGEAPEPGFDVSLGIARVSTSDSEVPSEAFLNSPEARIVLWVECLSN